jgi:hypothetical protein
MLRSCDHGVTGIEARSMGNEKYDHGIRLLTQSISERPVPTPDLALACSRCEWLLRGDSVEQVGF